MSRLSNRFRLDGPLPAAILGVGLVALLFVNDEAFAQPYAETERVTVIDLPVELRSLSGDGTGTSKSSKGLTVEDFDLLVDGQPRDLIALARPGEIGPLPYKILVYVDSELSDSREIRVSLERLAAMASEITDLGVVDLVVADPEPRFVLREIGDAELLENALLSPDWADAATDQLRALRAAFLDAQKDPDSEQQGEELAETFVREEGRLVQERADLLLSFLVDHLVTGRMKALLLAGVQYDLEPGDFYRPLTGSELGESADLDRTTRGLAAGLAAYGWLTYPIAAPKPESPLVSGARIGKWRVAGPAGGRIIGLRIARESERDPERARAHLENGQALLAKDAVVEAEEAFRDALHHFQGDPKTASEQAEALWGLAAALEAQGKEDEARENRELALSLDSSVAGEASESLPVLRDPQASLGELAAQTSGRVLHDDDDLATALGDLRRRVRLSFQFQGVPTGDLFAAEVRTSRTGWTALGPRWVRFGTLEAVAAARMRLFLGSGEAEAPADLEVRLDRDPEPGTIRLALQLKTQTGETTDESRCRLTLAAGSEEEETPRIEHRNVVCRGTELGLSSAESLTTGADYIAILLEHLESGVWGTTVVELE